MYTTFMVPWNAMELKLDGTSKIVLRPSPLRLIDTFFKVAQHHLQFVEKHVEGFRYGRI